MTCNQLEVTHGIGPVSKQPYVKLTDGPYERLLTVPVAKKFLKDLTAACNAAEKGGA